MDKYPELGKCCGSCKYARYGFSITYVCTNVNKMDKQPMYDVFDVCDKWEEKDKDETD